MATTAPLLWRDKAVRDSFLLYFILFSRITAFFLYYSILVQSGYRITALETAVTTVPFGIAAAALSSFSGPLAGGPDADVETHGLASLAGNQLSRHLRAVARTARTLSRHRKATMVR